MSKQKLITALLAMLLTCVILVDGNNALPQAQKIQIVGTVISSSLSSQLTIAGQMPIAPPQIPSPDVGLWVSPTGTTNGSGTRNDPTTLAIAVSGQRRNTVAILMDGTYNVTAITSSAVGIVVRAEHENVWPPAVTIDNGSSPFNLITLTPDSRNQIWRGIRLNKSDPKRISAQAGSNPTDIPRGGFGDLWVDQGTNNWLVQGLTENGTNGINIQNGFGGGVELVVSRNNGWSAPDRGHGHAIYIQNRKNGPRKSAINSVFLNDYADHVHIATSGRIAEQGNITLDGVVTSGDSSSGCWWILGGVQYGLEIRNSHLYKCGFSNNPSPGGDLTFVNNYFEAPGFTYGAYDRVTAFGNTIVNFENTQGREAILIRFPGSANSNYTIHDNSYYRGRLGPDTGSYLGRFDLNGKPMLWADWQALGLDAGSKYYERANEKGTRFTGQQGVRRGQNDVSVLSSTRSNWKLVVIRNPLLSSTVSVNVSGFAEGQAFDVYSVQSNKKLASGVYSAGSSIIIPMTTDDPPVPRFGDAASTPTTTMPGFGAVLIIPR